MKNEKSHWMTSMQAMDEELDVLCKASSAAPGQSKNEKKKNLVGLAFSGGGIRSATFNLGVLEGLKSLDLLEKVDYLSTVSGGGYIGAWLSAGCKRHLGFRRKASDWTTSIMHLRRYSNYLAPQLGFFSADTWSVLMVWIRNTLLVQATVILAIAAALIGPRLMMQPLFEGWSESGDWRWTTIALLIFGIVGIAGNLLRVSRMNRAEGANAEGNVPWVLLSGKWLTGLVSGGACLMTALLIGKIWDFKPFSYTVVDYRLAVPIALLLVAGGFLLMPAGAKVTDVTGSLIDRLRSKDRDPEHAPPTEINYNQGWVQAAVVAPLMVAGLLVAAVMWGFVRPGQPLVKFDTFGSLFQNAPHYWPFPLMIVFSSLLLLSYCSVRTVKTGYGILAVILAPVASILVLHALMCAIVLLFEYWMAKGPGGTWQAFVWGPPAVVYAFSLAIVTLIGIVGRQSKEGSREWWSRLGAWLGIYGMAWMVVCVASVYGPRILDLLEGWKGTLGTGWIGTTLAGLLAGNSGSTGTKGSGGKGTIEKVTDVVAKVAPFVFIAGLLLAVAMVIHQFAVANSAGNVAEMTYWFQLQNIDWRVNWYLAAGALALLTLFAARVDINEFSLNAFYRSRLVRCYLGASRSWRKREPQRFTNFDDGDDILLTGLQHSANGAADHGPLHLINCALNLGGSSDLTVHTRHSASFVLTPWISGSAYMSRATPKSEPEELGCMRHYAYRNADSQPTLGQAIAVSGAAASPNMGYHTSPVVAFLLTLFDVRLGWWFPKPRQKGQASPTPWFSLRYLFMELFGLANDTSKFLAISDGGHFENLGAYELVRRGCRVIVVGDAECDPDLKFEGLGALIRMCEVDYHVKIDIDVSSLAKQTSGWSQARCAVGKIHYKGSLIADAPDEGILVYLKASMTGKEGTSILQYKSGHETFPHESTGNQFYGEDQFESYRLLGREIADGTFRPAMFDDPAVTKTAGEKVTPAVIADRLSKIWSPVLPQVGAFTENTNQLMELWAEVGKRHELEFLDMELDGKWPVRKDPNYRQGHYIASRMLQLMENAYLNLGLEGAWDHPDNQGWQSLFKGWAKSEVVQRTWDRTQSTYGIRFRYFCERNLGLPLTSEPPGPPAARSAKAGGD